MWWSGRTKQHKTEILKLSTLLPALEPSFQSHSISCVHSFTSSPAVLAEPWRSWNPCATNLWIGREWGNVGTRGYPGHGVENTSTSAHLSLRRRGRQTGEWPPAWPVAEHRRRARNVSAPLGRPRHRELGEEAAEIRQAASTQTERVRSPRPLCYGLHSLAWCECRRECFGSESDGWLNLKGHGERNRSCVCVCVCMCQREKESGVIRIFLSNLCQVFQGLGCYINCCQEFQFISWNSSA